MTMRAHVLLSLTLALPLAATAQERDFSKTEIKATRVSGAVWLLQGEGGNIAATIGEDGIAIVDDEFATLAPKIKAALEKVKPGQVRFLINTHFHGDHTGANAIFGEFATILAHEAVRTRLEAGRTGERATPPAPRAALPVITFEQGLVLHFNGEPIKVIHLQPGHTDGDSAVWFTKSNVIHLGDAFVTYGFPFVDVGSGGSLLGMIGALDALVPQLPKDVKVIPGHGPLSTLDDVKKFARTLDEMVGVVRKGLAAGKSVEQLQKDKVLAAWAPWDGGFVKADAFIATIASDLAAHGKK